MDKKLKNEIKTFWNKWVDRIYMKSVIYPSIGNYLKNKKTKNFFLMIKLITGLLI